MAEAVTHLVVKLMCSEAAMPHYCKHADFVGSCCVVHWHALSHKTCELQGMSSLQQSMTWTACLCLHVHAMLCLVAEHLICSCCYSCQACIRVSCKTCCHYNDDDIWHVLYFMVSTQLLLSADCAPHTRPKQHMTGSPPV